MPAFMDRYPDIEIDIVASNRMVDVTDAGFDAGIRYGGTVPRTWLPGVYLPIFAGLSRPP